MVSKPPPRLRCRFFFCLLSWRGPYGFWSSVFCRRILRLKTLNRSCAGYASLSPYLLSCLIYRNLNPDWVQFQSFVFVHGMLFRIHVECFLDSLLQTVTFEIDDFHIVEIKGMLFEDRTLSSSRHVKSSAFDVGRVLLDAYSRLQLLSIATKLVPRPRFSVYIRMVEDTC